MNSYFVKLFPMIILFIVLFIMNKSIDGFCLLFLNKVVIVFILFQTLISGIITLKYK